MFNQRVKSTKNYNEVYKHSFEGKVIHVGSYDPDMISVKITRNSDTSSKVKIKQLNKSWVVVIEQATMLLDYKDFKVGQELDIIEVYDDTVLLRDPQTGKEEVVPFDYALAPE